MTREEIKEKIEPTNYCIDTLREKINKIIDYLNKEK